MKIHKNFLTTIALWCTLLGMIWCLGTPQVYAQMTITDNALAAGIRAQLGIPGTSNTFTSAQVTQLTFLSVDGKGKSDGDRVEVLTGLNAAIALTHLNLANNKIQDISALASLTSLTHLNLANNSLEDNTATTNGIEVIRRKDDAAQPIGSNGEGSVLGPLRGLINLQYLNLSHNFTGEYQRDENDNDRIIGRTIRSIRSIRALRKLRALDELILNNNHISDFSALVDNSLVVDRLGDHHGLQPNEISGLRSGAQVWLGRNHFHNNNNFHNVQLPLLIKQGVIVYSASGKVVVAIPDEELRKRLRRAAAAESHLGQFLIEGGAILTEEPLSESELLSITTLDLSYGGDLGEGEVANFNGLEYCTNLTELNLENLYVGVYSGEMLNPLMKMTWLRKLNLSNTDLDPNNVPEFNEDNISAIYFLKNFKELRSLNLSQNWIADIYPLTELTNLEELNLTSNEITIVNPFRDFGTNLKTLWVAYNPFNTSDTTTFDPEIFRDLLARNPELVTDLVIVKSYAYAPDPDALAFRQGGYIDVEVEFHGEIDAAEESRPYLALAVDGVRQRAPWQHRTYNEASNSTTVLFASVDPLPPNIQTDEVSIERLKIPGWELLPKIGLWVSTLREGFGALIQWLPTEPDPNEIGATRVDIVVRPEWFSEPLRGKPFITTQPTVQLSRAGGTGTATDDFNVEITFSGPLNAASAAALASKISFGDVVGISIGSLTRPEPTAYEPETWTLSVSVAQGVSGDVTVTLDPEGLGDMTDPGYPIASEGSTLSLTVPVDRPQDVPETGETTDVATVGSSLEFPISFVEDGVTYEGTAKPYITIYVGERVAANERNAVWARAEDVNSTLVTFTYEIGAGDLASSVSLKTEEGISIPEGTTFVSETLRVAGEDPPASGPGETPRKSSTDAAEPVAGNLSLTSVGGSTRVSLRAAIAVPTVLEIRQEIVGSVYIPETAEETKTGASSVPRSPIVFNELGNGSGDANDWLEFRNVTGSAVSLKDWELSVVQDGKKEDTSLIVFGDVSVPANGLLLITNSDPSDEDNLLAAGDDIAGSGKNGGLTHLYLVNSGLSLPDDGKFLLILRNAKEKLGKDEAFVDVAGGGGSGTDAFVREQSGSYDTHVWPLQVREAPGGDTEEALGSGKVWQRAKADIVGYHKDAWAQAAFTGLGYDRKVTKSDAYAGTPGYPNGAVKTEASTPKGSITISEVMFDSGGGKLPQWVELYNKSKTEAINLNRWKLELQNVASGDLVGRPIVTLTLGEKVIQPNQTLLIVAGPARASSGSLPADRVYDLLALHEKNLRIKKPQDTFLSAIGFYLKLSDANGTKIDEVGNTDGNRRTNEVPAWALPVSLEEGVRSSLIRRYTKGTSTAEDGMERGSWVLAANIRRFVAGSEAFHWGHADDIGTPGYRGGGPLPVELSSFAVKRAEAGAVVVTWTTESEVDNAGFNLRRSEKRDSGWTLLNPALIAGAGTTGERQAYTFTDTSAKPGVEYYYQIEEVAFDGRPVTLVTRFLPGPVSASNRMLTTFGGMKKSK